MNPLGLYLPGTTPVHRAPAAVKLLLMLALGVASVFLDRAWEVAAVLLAVVVGYAVARIPFRTAVAQVRPLLWVVGFAAIVHVFLDGWTRAFVVVGVVVALVMLAGLVTLTTRTDAMADAVVGLLRPLRHVGVDTERIGLVLALGIRCVPVVVGLAEEVRDAQRARGLTASPRAFAVPLVVRSLRHADALGEALLARGVED
ncbi:MAG TPA: energy-coupling factor transporter transmembrane protein EcfT [Nocardioidaceae bacterium]|nr:energy-coupling factor transporter transmembrane protein EcfT [Nocardioidaceae bacterium]